MVTVSLPDGYERCNRCGEWSYEILKTHGHCINCLYSVDVDRRKLKTRKKPLTTKKYRSPKTFCFLSVAISCILIGCSDFKVPQIDKPSLPVESDTPEKAFRAIVHQGAAPNEYRLELTWNDLAKPQSWQIHRAEGDGEFAAFRVIEGDRRHFVDTSAEPGKTYRYLLGYTERGDFVIYGRTRATIPVDVYIDKRLTRSNFEGINRVFLAEEGTLHVGTPSFEMNVEEIISFGGTIASRPVNSGRHYFAQPTGKPETIQIKAKRGKGNLKIIARGFRGYRGSKYEISPGKIRLDGTDGGDTPVLKVTVDEASELNVEVERIAGKGGKAAPGGKDGRDGRISPFCLILGDRVIGECSES